MDRTTQSISYEMKKRKMTSKFLRENTNQRKEQHLCVLMTKRDNNKKRRQMQELLLSAPGSE